MRDIENNYLQLEAPEESAINDQRLQVPTPGTGHDPECTATLRSHDGFGAKNLTQI